MEKRNRKKRNSHSMAETQELKSRNLAGTEKKRTNERGKTNQIRCQIFVPIMIGIDREIERNINGK